MLVPHSYKRGSLIVALLHCACEGLLGKLVALGSSKGDHGLLIGADGFFRRDHPPSGNYAFLDFNYTSPTPPPAQEIHPITNSTKRATEINKSTANTRGLRSCPCIGVEGITGETQADFGGGTFVRYPRDVGSHCMEWDDGRFPSHCQDGDILGPGKGNCGQRWCFVDPCNCKLPNLTFKATYFPHAMAQGRPLYYSYATCRSNSTFDDVGPDLEDRSLALVHKVSTVKVKDVAVDASRAKHLFGCEHEIEQKSCNQLPGCTWKPALTEFGQSLPDKGLCLTYEVAIMCENRVDAQVWGQAECPCVGIKGLPGLVRVKLEGGVEEAEYPADVGSYCHSWHNGNHPQCRTPEQSEYCDVRWCFVDPCACLSASSWRQSSLFPAARVDGRLVYVSNTTCNFDEAIPVPEEALDSVTQRAQVMCESSSDTRVDMKASRSVGEEDEDSHEK